MVCREVPLGINCIRPDSSLSQLKQECLRRAVLFEDSDFPACNSSLFFSENPPIPFVWKRCYFVFVRLQNC
uniref:Uncharacterized protein n=1 Tax=Cyanistes caeruleus TaxID=156563 RepID=A0A8C0URY4_CYACU